MAEQRSQEITRATVEALIERLDWGNSTFAGRREVHNSLRFLLAAEAQARLSTDDLQLLIGLAEIEGSRQIVSRHMPELAMPDGLLDKLADMLSARSKVSR